MMMRKTVKGFFDFLVTVHPVRLVLLGYISYILVSTLLLSLPFSQKNPVSALDNFFTSTSAISTTGLVTTSISDSYNFFGQIVILLLIQLGGLGYMTFSSFIILSRKKALSPARTDVAEVVFSLPESFNIFKFIRSAIIFTAVIETAGAVVLYMIFKRNGVADPVWSAVFHSISSFCTAGFSLYNNSFEAFAGNFWLNMTICALSYLGAVGFIVCVDVWRRVTNKIKRVTLTTKIILSATFWVSLTGTIVFFITEPSIRAMPLDERLLASFFQSMTAMTTVGFNTIHIGGISRSSVLLLTMLMIIGASPSGTGGGVKSTTFSALIGIIKSSFKGQDKVSFWGRLVPEQRIRLAMATFCFYVSFLIIGMFFLTLTEPEIDFGPISFEAASALGTVGLSTGITASLGAVSKLILVILMFIGRLGPLTFGLSLFIKQPGDYTKHQTEQESAEKESDLAI